MLISLSRKVIQLCIYRASQVVLVVKNPSADAGNARGAVLIPRSGRSPGGGNGNSLHYSCLENPMDRGARWVRAMGPQRVKQNWATEHTHTRMHTHTHTHIHTYIIHTYIHIYIHIILYILSYNGLSRDIEYSSLCYTVGCYSLSETPSVLVLWFLAYCRFSKIYQIPQNVLALCKR